MISVGTACLCSCLGAPATRAVETKPGWTNSALEPGLHGAQYYDQYNLKCDLSQQAGQTTGWLTPLFFLYRDVLLNRVWFSGLHVCVFNRGY